MCPLVTKVHHEVKVRAGKGYRIVYVGHEGHEEAVGTMAVAPDAIHLVETTDDVAALPAFDEPVALLAQTTLSHREWADVLDGDQRAVPRAVDAGAQRPVLRHHQPPVGADGDRRPLRRHRRDRLGQLVEHPGPRAAGLESGCARVLRVNDADELPDDLTGTVGVTAGASAPEELVEAVIARLRTQRGRRGGRDHRRGRVLPAPRELRDLLTRRRRRGDVHPRRLGRAAAAVSTTAALAASTVLADLACKSSGHGIHVHPHGRVDRRAVGGDRRRDHQEPARVADSVLDMLRSLAGVTDGFAVDQLTHCLQTATRAERAGADAEVVVASLCHDIGKAISVFNHPAIAAEILRPYVRPEVTEMIRVHQDFQGRHYYHHFGGDPDAREKHRDALDPELFGLAERFADEWDQTAFDPDYDTLPLEHFEPLVRDVFASPKHL